MPIRPNQHFLYLDGMRGVAALFVGLLHAEMILGGSLTTLPNAHLAVDFFFCLSGFVVAYAYVNRLDAGLRISRYFELRMIRLAPLVLAGLTLGGVALIGGAIPKGHDRFVEATVISVLSLFLIPAGLIFGYQAFPSNSPVWSLFFELFANVVVSINTVRRHLLNAWTLLITGFALAIAVWQFRSLDHLGFESPLFFFAGYARVSFPFLAGVLIWQWRLYEQRREVWSWIAFFLLPALLAFPLGNWLSDLFAVFFLIPLFVIAGTANARDIFKPFLLVLGEISYPFYIIHQPILRIVKNSGLTRNLVDQHSSMAIIISLVTAVIFALAFSRLYDLPVRKRLLLISNRRAIRSVL